MAHKKLFTILPLIFFAHSLCFGATLFETENFIFSIDSYLRSDLIAFDNVVDLDTANKDDAASYLGIDYSVAFKSEPKAGGPKFYLKLERNGPGDYDAPLFIHNTLINSGGRIEAYRNDELLPQLEEFWVDTPILNKFGLKAGLYTYEVGNSFSLNGSYENYGLTFYRESEDLSWRLHYFRPDVVYKNHLGPRIRQDEDQGYVYNHNASNFFAADLKLGNCENYLQPYIGVLADYTSPSKRDNAFAAPIKRDFLGTLGFAWKRTQDKLTFNFEGARNFGKAESEDPQYKDIYHAGYLVYTKLDYAFKRVIPYCSFLLASGNKVTLDAAENQEEFLAGGKNMAFSSYSPLNKNLGDSISACNSDTRPLVFMGSGCGIHTGIPRPRTLASSDFENIIIPSLGFDLKLTDKLSTGLYGYYLSSFARGVGTLGGQGKYLSRDLGCEADLSVDYKLTQNITLSFWGGYFFPGKFYKEQRDDVNGSLLSPSLRIDAEANSAYQAEFSVEVRF